MALIDVVDKRPGGKARAARRYEGLNAAAATEEMTRSIGVIRQEQHSKESRELTTTENIAYADVAVASDTSSRDLDRQRQLVSDSATDARNGDDAVHSRRPAVHVGILKFFTSENF